MPARTSQSDPIFVSWLPCERPGKIGLTIAPGKHGHSKSGPRWERDLAADLDRLKDEHGVSVLVCLLEDEELGWLKIPDYVTEVERRGITLHRLPIPDGGVLPELAPVQALVQTIDDHLKAGETVVIHCAGGLGRAGTIGGCWLTTQGHTADEAIEILHAQRAPNSPETPAQERFIDRFEDEVG